MYSNVVRNQKQEIQGNGIVIKMAIRRMGFEVDTMRDVFCGSRMDTSERHLGRTSTPCGQLTTTVETSSISHCCNTGSYIRVLLIFISLLLIENEG